MIDALLSPFLVEPITCLVIVLAREGKISGWLITVLTCCITLGIREGRMSRELDRRSVIKPFWGLFLYFIRLCWEVEYLGFI